MPKTAMTEIQSWLGLRFSLHNLGSRLFLTNMEI
jgi:hypothetical protein